MQKNNLLCKKRTALLKSMIALVCITPILCFSQGAARPVRVDTVQMQELPVSTTLTGIIHSKGRLTITAGIDGRVDWIAEPGTYIKQGEALAAMDTVPLTLQREEYVAQVQRAKINAQYLKNELSRLETLKKTNSIAQHQIDQIENQFELAKAEMKIAELKRMQIEDRLGRAKIQAPFEALVTQRLVRSGNDVDRGEELLKIVDTQNMEVRVQVPLKYLSSVRRGDVVEIISDKGTINSLVTATIPSADPLSQTFEMRAALPPEHNPMLVAGQILKVNVPMGQIEPMLTVPRDALIIRNGKIYVAKVDHEQIIKQVDVLVGIGSPDRVAVSGALNAGDRIAVRGAEQLAEGAQVVLQ